MAINMTPGGLSPATNQVTDCVNTNNLLWPAMRVLCQVFAQGA